MASCAEDVGQNLRVAFEAKVIQERNASFSPGFDSFFLSNNVENVSSIFGRERRKWERGKERKEDIDK